MLEDEDDVIEDCIAGEGLGRIVLATEYWRAGTGPQPKL